MCLKGGRALDSRASTSIRGATAAVVAVALAALTVSALTPAAATAQPTGTTVTTTPGPAPAIVPGNGFLLSKGRFTTIDPPGSVRTKPTAISNRGQVLFKYVDASGSPRAAVRDPRGVYRGIAVPGAVFTEPYDSDEHGRIVGDYADSAGVLHGFLRDTRGRYRTIDVPGAAQSAVFSINRHGEIAGASRTPPGPSTASYGTAGAATAPSTCPAPRRPARSTSTIAARSSAAPSRPPGTRQRPGGLPLAPAASS
jgi:hypothetical protein